jgi:hypothetical protein
MNNNKNDFMCKICKKKYASRRSLYNHNKKFHNKEKNKEIINNELQGKDLSFSSVSYHVRSHDNEINKKLICKYCNKIFSHYNNKWAHQKICKNKDQIITINKNDIDNLKNDNKDKEIKLLKKELELKNEIIKIEKEFIDILNKKLNLKIDKCENELYKIKISSESNKTDINNQLIDLIVDKTNTIHDLKNKIDENKNVEIKQEEIITKKTTLTLNDVVIISRSEDNYINATQLCQAGGKKFNDWVRLDSTKQLIFEAESEAGIPASQLIDIKKGNSKSFNQGTWIHPDMAIQLAQWISPTFALQVSKWIRTLFTYRTVSVDIKLIKEKEDEIKLKDEKIKLLENTFVKKQKRLNKEKNVIYLLTTEDNLKKRIYILGKAKRLSDRLSTYNKTCEHVIIHTKECNNEKLLTSAETLILDKLDKFREKANRDRFILPIDKDINYFKEIIDKYVDYVNSSNNIII